jgi:hypothetical protein
MPQQPSAHIHTGKTSVSISSHCFSVRAHQHHARASPGAKEKAIGRIHSTAVLHNLISKSHATEEQKRRSIIYRVEAKIKRDSPVAIGVGERGTGSKLKGEGERAADELARVSQGKAREGKEGGQWSIGI